jgi:hypothetical protein
MLGGIVDGVGAIIPVQTVFEGVKWARQDSNASKQARPKTFSFCPDWHFFQ